ncbi:hypothetical protein SS1G_13388 [Sclerotinia sclerotiorum 1980 UF-70]|uniref:RNA polymerase II assembly factor Rtp1 C-terminal domain-containing protein n=2 Tax=Sclerotinia sclerotiorum (strain ATCC 18683 / 1980 / Ss-1) TaxID=665079 RepID=A7F708_SCLS1|nr:hypothetical protein SS1G_13388 [Sclerotinia sclerotiorum 1980 UF-70]APA15463.1 hypothetical protein sscle_15g102330 [Sclerotinia sclerotiorum 1980 UF-70]EDN98529.1 hypothetical protein SS1G_13388 [Sclerotinia sclerotiorum 1980 UF-70]
MSGKQNNRTAQQPLVDKFLQVGKAAFDPDIPESTRFQSRHEFDQLIESTSTIKLMPVLNLLVQPDRVHPWLRGPLIHALARLPLRRRGVQDTIEFVFSVHPSNASMKASDTVGSRAVNISHEAMSSASRLLSAPPHGMSAEKWFGGIAPQLFDLLDGKGEKEMDKAASYIIGFGILGRKLYGAPGTPGWKALVEPIIGMIDPYLTSQSTKRKSRVEEIIILGMPEVLVSAEDLERSLLRLLTLVTSHPHPSLTKRLLNPILLPLWALQCVKVDASTEGSRACAKRLLKILLQLSSSTVSNTTKGPLSKILHNILFQGRSEPGKANWMYHSTKDGRGIQIEKPPNHINSNQNLDIGQINTAVETFVALLNGVPEIDSQVSQIFLTLCQKWLSQAKTRPVPSIIIHASPTSDEEDVKTKLIEAKVLQEMIDTMPEKLVQDSRQLVELIDGVLNDSVTENGDSEDQENIVAIALSLLNIILTSPNFKPTPAIEPFLERIESSLRIYGRKTDTETTQTAQNLLIILRFRHALHESSATLSNDVPSRATEDRKTYNLAMSYLTSVESPPPVRVQGIELIQTLIGARSSILDIPALLVLFSSLLQDSDEYVYLRAIRCFIDLSKVHPRAVLEDIIERYVDGNEDYDLDARLRLGEALLQVIQSSPMSFTGAIAQTVSEGLLSVAGRRGYRPKTDAERVKRENLQKMKTAEAEEAWDGPVPQLDEVLESDASHPEFELISRIISGWESKRGTEDIRIRSSALAILGEAIDCNVAGIGSKSISMSIDLSIHILTLEPEVEKGILRRSAILLVMSFVRSLDKARSEGRHLGFGFVGRSLDDITRILKYVQNMDNDGLVRQHAKDVVEGIKSWQMNSLIPIGDSGRGDSFEHLSTGGIGSLAGLNITPVDRNGNVARPKIEEIE